MQTAASVEFSLPFLARFKVPYILDKQLHVLASWQDSQGLLQPEHVQEKGHDRHLKGNLSSKVLVREPQICLAEGWMGG